MNLKILLPTEVLVAQPILKITAEAENGYFTLLPHHIDFVTALVPGILSFLTLEQEEKYIAIDEGILVKCGLEVLVSSRRGIEDDNLAHLQQTVAEKFKILDEQERKARSAAAKLEANLVRKFIAIEK